MFAGPRSGLAHSRCAKLCRCRTIASQHRRLLPAHLRRVAGVPLLVVALLLLLVLQSPAVERAETPLQPAERPHRGQSESTMPSAPHSINRCPQQDYRLKQRPDMWRQVIYPDKKHSKEYDSEQQCYLPQVPLPQPDEEPSPTNQLNTQASAV